MMSASVSGLNCLGVNSNVGSLIQRLEKEQEDREQNREQKEPKDKEVDKETFIKEVKEKAEQIKKEQKELFSLLSSSLDSSKTGRDDVRKEISSLNEQIESMRAEMNKIQEKHLNKQKRIKEMENKVNNKGAELEKHRKELEDYCNHCTNFLGLDILPTTKDTTIFSFTQIDPKDEGKKFLCEVSTSYKEDEKKFKVVRCEPELPCDVVSQLEDLLNKTGDLSGFVVALRRTYLATIS